MCVIFKEPVSVCSTWSPPKVQREGPKETSSYLKTSTFYRTKKSRRKDGQAQQDYGKRLSHSDVLFDAIRAHTIDEVFKKVQAVLALNPASVNSRDSAGQTPLMYAVIHNRGTKCLKTIDILATHDANVNVKDYRGRTAIYLAIKCGNKAAAMHMLKIYHYLDVNVVCDGNESLLRLCIRLGEWTLDIVRGLMDTGRLNVNTAGSKQQTALHLAASRGFTSTVKALLEYGADVNCRDANGQTPLHLAAVGFHPDVIRALLNAGANASIVDSEGKTAAQASAHKFYGVGLETVNSFLDESSRKDIKVDWEASSFLQMSSLPEKGPKQETGQPGAEKQDSFNQAVVRWKPLRDVPKFRPSCHTPRRPTIITHVRRSFKFGSPTFFYVPVVIGKATKHKNFTYF